MVHISSIVLFQKHDKIFASDLYGCLLQIWPLFYLLHKSTGTCSWGSKNILHEYHIQFIVLTWGGLMIAEKFFTPNIPRFETVIVPPWNSWGCSLFSRALTAKVFMSELISWRPLKKTNDSVVNYITSSVRVCIFTCNSARKNITTQWSWLRQGQDKLG